MATNTTRMMTGYNYSTSRGQRTSWAKVVMLLVAALAISVGFLLGALTARAASPQDDLRNLNANIEQAITLLDKGDKAGAQEAYTKFDKGWFDIEDGVKAQSRPTYKAIEDALSDVKFTFNLQPFDQTKAMDALKKLDGVNEAFINSAPASTTTTQTDTSSSKASFKSLVGYLNESLDAIAANNPDKAAAEIKEFQAAWPSLETFVSAKSVSTYSAIENNMARAYAQLKSSPADLGGAKTSINQIKTDLAPYVEGNSYGVFDATTVLLREGLEALLVIAALLTFLNRSGNADKRKIIWIGSGLGIAASLVVAVILNLIFAGAESAGANREIMEGLTGLFAASMLFYMSYWLHSKSNTRAWQKYIKVKSTAALATGRAFSLGLLAFLAVFREGAETALLYMGIAPSISLSDLLLGIGIGLAALAALAVLILVAGMKLPLRPFFQIASFLIFYIGFKFIGTGIHSLQVAGLLPASPASYLPENSFFGIFPTWETTIAQGALLLIGAGWLIWSKVQDRRLSGNESNTTSNTAQPIAR